MNEEVLFDAIGSARMITLNRTKALNALNLNMAEKIISSMQVDTTARTLILPIFYPT